MESIKKKILVSLDNLGLGRSEPVAYDTAWISRIPDLTDPRIPAFPKSLHWLREHQNPDGSWGTITPFSAHSLTLNTLSAIAALTHWNQLPEDTLQVQKGLKALHRLAPLLKEEKSDYVAFELILPCFVETLKKLGIQNLPTDAYAMYNQIYEIKMDLITKQLKTKKQKSGTWAHSLEIFGEKGLPECLVGNSKEELLKFAEIITSKDGLIFASPAASAHMLTTLRKKGIDSPSISKYLTQLTNKYDGGAPVIDAFHNFELIFGLELLLKAGISAKDPMLHSKIQDLLKVYNNSPQGISFSNDFKLPDSDDTAVGLRILHLAGHKVSLDSLLRFWNGKYFDTFIGERTSSISANINILYSLRFFENEYPEVKELIDNLLNWIRENWVQPEIKESNYDEVFLPDKWHISHYYVTSRAVFALKGIENDVYGRCIQFFLNSQNLNGGWGKDGISTAEETASVILALLHSNDSQNQLKIQRSIKDGYNYIQNDKKAEKGTVSGTEPIWMDKVLYSVPALKEAAILGVEFAMEMQIRQRNGECDEEIFSPPPSKKLKTTKTN